MNFTLIEKDGYTLLQAPGLPTYWGGILGTLSNQADLQTALSARQPIGASTASATTGTMTVTMAGSVIKITPTGACTFNASGGVAGAAIHFVITTSGTSSFVMTFGTNFRSTGTLATGTVSAKKFVVSFICEDGTTWVESGRTTAV